MERRPISLAAVVAGILVTTFLEVLLLMLGAAIGLTALSALEQTRGTTELGYGVYLIASLVVSVFSGALVAAVASRSPFRGDGLLHGLVVWAALGVVSLFLIGKNADSIVGGALRLVRHTVVMESPAPTPSAEPVVEQVKQTVQHGIAVVNAAEETRHDLALGLWSFLGVEALLLMGALAGGAMGTRGERRFRRKVAAVPAAPLIPQAS